MTIYSQHPLITISIDRGGTFTDVYAQCNDHEVVIKLLSEDPANYPDAPREGIKRVINKLKSYGVKKRE